MVNEEKRGRGRPRKAPGEARSKLQVWLLPDVRAALEAAAASTGTTMSRYVEMVLQKDLQPSPERRGPSDDGAE